MSQGPAKYSCLRPVPAYQETSYLCYKKAKPRDPRFSSGCRKQYILHDYAFILEKRESELKQLQNRLSSEPHNAELKQYLLHEKQKINDIKARNAAAQLKQQLVYAESQAVSAGKQRFYMRKRDVRRAVSAAQFAAQKARGNAQRVLKRKNERVSK